MKKGFSVIEIILAAAVFVIFASGIAQAVVWGLSANRLGEEQTIANQFASEGIEAARSIKNQAFGNLVNSAGTGVSQTGGVWVFSGTNNQFGPGNKYTRVLKVEDVQRDGSGNIVTSGGTVDPLTKKITSTVTWNASPSRVNSVVLSTYLTNWRLAIGKGGMLVYGDGGTTSDAIKYKILDGSGNWSAAAAAASVGTGRYLRVARVYASPTRNEKILVSRHFNGTSQWIFAQVYNGSTWGNLVQLSTWSLTTFQDVQNFDGAYLSNGNFVVVYSDNSVIPKMQVWNGTSWPGQTSLTTLGGTNIPSYIILKNRSGTNEAMAAFFTQTPNAITQYYSGSAWSAITTHGTAAPLTTKKFIDFVWSTNTPLNGLLVYTNSATEKTVRGRIWVANGTGNGAWGTAVVAAAQTNNMGALAAANRPLANEFAACNKDAGATPTIVCRKATFSGNVLTWTTPTNPILAAATDTGIQKSFDITFEGSTGAVGLNVYGDNTTTPKYKKFTPGTSTWDAAATNMAILTGAVKAVRLIPKPGSDDILSLVSDANLDIWSYLWDGTANTMSSSTSHGTNGSAITDFWYDFTWDNF